MRRSGVVVADPGAGGGGGEGSGDDCLVTAAPILPCGQSPDDASFSFTTTDDYSVCAFHPSDNPNWATTTLLNRPRRGQSHSPSATIRDGVPGNWCYTEDDLVVDKTGEFVTSYWLLQPTCANGGAGGDEIPVRNTDTFYLATWRGNVVDACPGVSPDDVCPPSNGG